MKPRANGAVCTCACGGLDIEAVAQRAAEILLARMTGAIGPQSYSTRKGHAPPAWTDEGWRCVAETVPGSYRPTSADGKPSRWIVTPRAAFDSWVASRSAGTAPSAAVANDAAAWDPSSVLSELGLKRAR